VTCDRFSPGTPVSSTNKTVRHDITEILLKVALKTPNPNQNHLYIMLLNNIGQETYFFYFTFQEEIRQLRQKLKETEMSAEHEKYMKTKLTEDNANLVRENSVLNQQVVDFQIEVDRVSFSLRPHHFLFVFFFIKYKLMFIFIEL
jgi:hypothetical protein